MTQNERKDSGQTISKKSIFDLYGQKDMTDDGHKKQKTTKMLRFIVNVMHFYLVRRLVHIM